jgi:hypothetical protein
MVSVEQSVECRLAGETEVLGENLPCPSIPHDLTCARTRATACGKPATNRLSYGTASKQCKLAFPAKMSAVGISRDLLFEKEVNSPRNVNKWL